MRLWKSGETIPISAWFNWARCKMRLGLEKDAPTSMYQCLTIFQYVWNSLSLSTIPTSVIAFFSFIWLLLLNIVNGTRPMKTQARDGESILWYQISMEPSIASGEDISWLQTWMASSIAIWGWHRGGNSWSWSRSCNPGKNEWAKWKILESVSVVSKPPIYTSRKKPTSSTEVATSNMDHHHNSDGYCCCDWRCSSFDTDSEAPQPGSVSTAIL